MASSSSAFAAYLRTFRSRCQSPPSVAIVPEQIFYTKTLYFSRAKPIVLSVKNPSRSNLRLQSSMSENLSSEKQNTDVQIFESEENLSASLAKYTADLSEKFAKERGAFSVVLSGGSLIKSLRKLVESPYVDSIDWAKWHVFWVDERVVPKDHVDSNYKLAYDLFLSKSERRKEEKGRKENKESIKEENASGFIVESVRTNGGCGRFFSNGGGGPFNEN